MAEKTVDRKSFDLRLAAVSEGTRQEYQNILTNEQIRRAKENKGKPVAISTAERELFLNRATKTVLYGKVDPQRMARDWEAASRNGRPPIGGAQDN